MKKSALKTSTIEHDTELGYLTINDGGYPYHIELRRIPDREALADWVRQLNCKTWGSGALEREFIDLVCEIKGWPR